MILDAETARNIGTAAASFAVAFFGSKGYAWFKFRKKKDTAEVPLPLPDVDIFREGWALRDGYLKEIERQNLRIIYLEKELDKCNEKLRQLAEDLWISEMKLRQCKAECPKFEDAN